VDNNRPRRGNKRATERNGNVVGDRVREKTNGAMSGTRDSEGKHLEVDPEKGGWME